MKWGDAYVSLRLYPWKGISMSVYEALMFALAFATLVFMISNNKDDKK